MVEAKWLYETILNFVATTSIYLKLARISFWQKSGQSWLNGGHYKKVKIKNPNG